MGSSAPAAPSRPPSGALRSGPHTGSGSAWEPDHTELTALTAWLLARPGDSLDLEMIHADDPQLASKAKAAMARDGVVVILEALTPAQLEQMQRTTDAAIQMILNNPKTNQGRTGNRGSFRFSFGSAFMMGLIPAPASMPGWHALVDPPPVTAALTAIFETADYRCTGLAGDFCLPGCNQYQQMHSDGQHRLDTPKPPSIVVNYPMVDFTLLNGPMRVIPGGSHHWAQEKVALAAEPNVCCSATDVWIALSCALP